MVLGLNDWMMSGIEICNVDMIELVSFVLVCFLLLS